MVLNSSEIAYSDNIKTAVTTATENSHGLHEANDLTLSSRMESNLPFAGTPESNATPHDNSDHHALLQTDPASPSLVRRLTTYLKAPLLKGSSSSSRPLVPVSSFRSLRGSRGRSYTNLGDDDDDADSIPVDLSSIGGLGFELQEMSATDEHPWIDQDTAYTSPQLVTGSKPDFQSFVKGRALGQGMDRSIRLKQKPANVSERNLTHKRLSSAELIQRHKTVRYIGQNLAQERNAIVAVSESVDLSILEGRFMNKQRASQSFDTMLPARTTLTENGPQSYFFPEDPDVPSWKPFSMSMPFILFLIISALSLAGVQEYLCQWSIKEEKNNSGILAFDQVAQISDVNFFAWKYLPTMITIVYAVLFSIMDFDIRRLEPYYQLSQRQGSTAAASLNLDHLTMFQYFVPFKAMRLKQWTVACSTVANIVASTVAPALQNPSINFVDNGDPSCKPKLGCSNGQKAHFVRIDPIWSRLLTCSYLVVALIGIFLFIQLRRKSGLLSDPKGIAGIASMATKSHILHDFKGADLSTRAEIHKRLGHRHFVLYQSSIWQGQWSPNSEPNYESERRLESPHPLMLRLSAGVPFVGFMVFCLAMVPVISLTRGNIIPNAAPWLPILIATILKLVWTTFEADVRLIEPFYQLSKGNARPENSLTLDYQATVYGLMPFIAAFNGHWLVATVGLCSVTLDVLSVTVGSFSVNAEMFLSAKKDISSGDETTISFWASVILSMAILTFVIFTTCLVYSKRRHSFLPREPSTIAAVLAFIYASKMLDDFIGTERLTSKQMEDLLKRKEKRYGLGWFTGRDGQVHCAIDEEPMRSHYVHGQRYDRALAGPMGRHDHFHYV